MLKYLKRDALNRAWRTFLHTVIAAGLIAGADAAVQVAVNAVVSKAAGGAVDWQQVLHAAGYAGTVAAVAPLLAYLHRLRLDPSQVPSALPPAPPSAPRGS